MKRALVIASCVGFFASAVAAQDFSEVEIKASHVAGSVWALEGAGGNIGVSVGADGVLMVDDQFAPLSEKIHRAVDAIGGGELRFVLNTHYHGDHTGGNVYFGLQAPILAHHNVRVRRAVAQTVRGRESEPLPPEALPVITYDDGLSIHFNGEEIRVLHIPAAHTDGDSIVWFTGSNVVHVGDLLFDDHFPFIDVEHGGSVDGLLDGIRHVLDIVPADATVICGHFGPAVSTRDLAANLEALSESVAIIRRGIAAGKDLEQLTHEGLPERFSEWSWGFVPTTDWIETVVRSTAAATGDASKTHSVN